MCSTTPTDFVPPEHESSTITRPRGGQGGTACRGRVCQGTGHVQVVELCYRVGKRSREKEQGEGAPPRPPAEALN